MEILLSNIEVLLPRNERLLFRIKELRIRTGSRTLIYGPSGIGKTTLLHVIAGLLLPDHGSVTVGDRDMHLLTDLQRSKFRRKYFGIVFQRLNLIDHLNVLENVLLPLPPAKESEKKSVQALEKVGLGTLFHERVGNLSLGEQQRLAVARVLASSPSLILADEPTSSLDDANATAVLDALLDSLSPCTTLVVSHDQRIRRRFDSVIDFERLIAS
jgi:putative ABC transport system ATP-binding protein